MKIAEAMEGRMCRIGTHNISNQARQGVLGMKSKVLGLLAVGMLAGPMAANAVVIGTENSNNCIPFGCNIVSEYQQVYSAELFTSPIVITSLSFYYNSFDFGSDGGFGYTLQPGVFSIYLSTTLDPVGGLTGVPGADELLVYSGAAPISSTGGFGGQYDFLLGSMYSYDPSAGNLLLRVSYSGPTEPIFVPLASEEGGLMSRLMNGANDDLRNVGLVTGFNEALGVPEPGTLALLGLGLAGLGLSRRRKTN